MEASRSGSDEFRGAQDENAPDLPAHADFADVRADHQKDGRTTRTEADRLAESVAHDLNGPILALENFASLLNERYAGLLDEKAERYLGYILDSCRALGVVHDGLCEYASRNQAPRPENVRLDGELREAVRNAGDSLGLFGARVTHDDLPGVWAERGAMATVFEYLVVYAAAHASPDSPGVHVSARGSGDRLVVSVADHKVESESAYGGCVLDLERCFASNGRVAGLGVGLALARQLIRRHGGDMWLGEDPRHGARIDFSLPA
ncbi:MAG: sensor histidine kinase [Desulfatibacillaceae bacterium]